MKEKNLNPNAGTILEIGTLGASAILSFLASIAPVNLAQSSITFLLSAYQTSQINKFINTFTERIENLEKSKLDSKTIESDEFIALVYQVVEIATKTTSNIKREKLANALINSVILANNHDIRNKEMLLRVLSGISDDEINMLNAIYKNLESYILKGKEESTFMLLDRGDIFLVGVQESTLESLLNLSQSDVRATGQGLAQLGLASYTSPDFWGLTTLGRTLVEWTIAVWNIEE